MFRARDGEEVTRAALFREGDNSWAGLTDVNLRIGVYGQLDFTLDRTARVVVGEQFGVVDPVLIDEVGKTLADHSRAEAARMLG